MKNIGRLNLKQLLVLHSLLLDPNLSRVGERIGLTQQAVSANLAGLRDIFGDPLFIRAGHGVTPTPFALGLAPDVNNAISALERLVDRAPFDPATTRATITLSTTDYAQQVAIVPRLSRMREQAPGLKLILSDIEVDAVAARMASGEIDLVMSIPDFVPAEFPRLTLFHEHYICVASRDSGFAGRKLSLGELAAAPHIVVSPARANLSGSADAWLRQMDLSRNVILSVPYFSLVPAVLEATGALAFLPSRLLPDPRLCVIPLENDLSPPGFDLICAWHARSAHSPLIEWMLLQLQ